jgi:hypothetical protein
MKIIPRARGMTLFKAMIMAMVLMAFPSVGIPWAFRLEQEHPVFL